jgi:hypothetical protein
VPEHVLNSTCISREYCVGRSLRNDVRSDLARGVTFIVAKELLIAISQVEECELVEEVDSFI